MFSPYTLLLLVSLLVSSIIIPDFLDKKSFF